MTPPLVSRAFHDQHVVILGGAYAGLSTALNLLRICDGTFKHSLKRDGKGGLPERHGRGGFRAQSLPPPRAPQNKPRITILDPRDGFYHAVETPMAHTSKGYISKPWRTWDEIPELKKGGVSVVKGTAVRADPGAKSLLYLSTDSEQPQQRSLDYDYLVVATGLRRSWPTVPTATNKAEYATQAARYIDYLQTCNSIVIIGGGAVGIEMAAEIKHSYPSKDVTLIHSRPSLLSSEPVSIEFRDQVYKVIQSGGVNVLLSNRVLEVTQDDNSPKTITLQNGPTISADEVIWATSSAAPITDFLPTEALDEKGFVKVLPTTQFSSNISNSTSHFAVGDVISTSGIRLAPGAIRMGKIAATNIAQMLVAKEDSDAGKPSFSIEQAQAHAKPPKANLKLVIGAFGAAYDSKTGDIMCGPEVKQRIFGDDMGLTRALGALGISSTP
ncbi:FAD/NAD(P)-binding domain-containing protein [Aspergillus sclerotioniger CBS 115572]|uniref:FAD/NAD(P)-binding domain-containing protein n=1 Tax=Aspergillus sclerotioniger CBS 115572 TaxID=1450535 RepID=A0A317VZJ8_9EURO|nr:FAD/NAD(P)-binding domain-containing protein [Aspergillus sclerotioniger CBS 115572]PWY77320.1 FAD/NAD(P)-binding domain-containing protein [Aspergillus sclerotioniger CBS 115572]